MGDNGKPLLMALLIFISPKAVKKCCPCTANEQVCGMADWRGRSGRGVLSGVLESWQNTVGFSFLSRVGGTNVIVSGGAGHCNGQEIA